MGSSLCRICGYLSSWGFIVRLAGAVPASLPPPSAAFLSASPHLSTETRGKSFRSIFKWNRCYNTKTVGMWTRSRIYPTSTLSCLSVGGAALHIICSSASPCVSVEVDKSFLFTVFSSILISSSKSIFFWFLDYFHRNSLLTFLQREEAHPIKCLFCLITVNIIFHLGGWVRCVSIYTVSHVAWNQKTTQVNSKVNSCKFQPSPPLLTNILISKSGFGFSMAMTTWPLLFAISDCSSSNTTSGTRFCPADSGIPQMT